MKAIDELDARLLGAAAAVGKGEWCCWPILTHRLFGPTIAQLCEAGLLKQHKCAGLYRVTAAGRRAIAGRGAA